MRRVLSLVTICCAGLAACGGDDAAGPGDHGPVVVATTSILGDVVDAAAGGLVVVDVVIPRGADPHDFAPSARAATEMEQADLVVAIGAGFEAGLADVVDAVASSGTPVLSLADAIGLGGDSDDDEHDDDEHADDEHDDDEHHGVDPHLWTDPTLVIEAVEALGDRLAELDGVDPVQVERSVERYLAELAELDASIERRVAEIPPGRRVLVTDHEVFGHFADRYGFEVVGAVVPSLTTNAETSARELEALADTIRAEGVPAIFVETTQSSRLAEALAAEVGDDVALVELHTESLSQPGGPAATYLELMRYDADAIAEALIP